MIVPAPLRRGDRIAVVAGSSPFDHTLAWRGIGWLAERFDVVFSHTMFTRQGYLAGSDARRADELTQALRDPSVRAIVAVRGGYGLTRVIRDLDLSLLEASPRWIVGFSDVTALHVEATRRQIASVHGPMVAALGRGDTRGRERWIDTLERPLAARSIETLRTLVSGVGEGPIVGGNLAMLHDAAASRRLELPRGAVLLLEDVTERPYRIDRMLTALYDGGHFDGLAGVILGEWTGCSPGADGITVEEVLFERLSRLGVPVLANAPVGHGDENIPIVLGSRWRLDGSRGRAEQVAGAAWFG
jgi:muramoyltetrapeptide carboxypeptidase